MRTDTTATETHTRKTRALLWTIQGLLALVFLFTGGMKLAMPAAALAQQAPLPPLFLKFIGLAEVAGALGLILPGIVVPGIVAVLAAFISYKRRLPAHDGNESFVAAGDAA